MAYSFEDIENLLSTMKDVDEIKISDIPRIDLYMDQVTTLFDDRLTDQKRNDSDAVLTKTMINNYAKAKILPPIKNKKYNKQQIILLVLIYNLKQIISLEDIKTLFDPILDRLSADTKDTSFLSSIYEQFLEEKSQQNGILVDDFIQKVRSSFDTENEEEDEQLLKLFMRVLLLISSANLQKRIAEKIIDTYFKKE